MFNPKEYLNNPVFNTPDPIQVQQQKNQAKKLEDEQIELERLCYETFIINENGQRLQEIYAHKFLDLGIFALGKKHEEFFRSHPMLATFYWEGFKDALRGQHTNGLLHKQRIAGVNG